MKSASRGSAHVSTRQAIGLCTHGSILICSPKNRLRPLDTFFRNSCMLVSDTQKQSTVNGAAQGYIREEKWACGIHPSPSWFSLASTQHKGEWDESPAQATSLADCSGMKEIQTRSFLWTITVGRNGSNIANGSLDDSISARGGQIWPFDSRGSTSVDDNCTLGVISSHPGQFFASLLLLQQLCLMVAVIDLNVIWYPCGETQLFSAIAT